MTTPHDETSPEPGPNDLDTPWEDAPPGVEHQLTEDEIIAGGLVVAGIVASTEIGPLPGLMFRFAKADGSGFVSVALVISDEQLGKTRALVRAATYAAAEAVKRARRTEHG